MARDALAGRRKAPFIRGITLLALVLLPILAACGGGGSAEEEGTPAPELTATEILQRASQQLAVTETVHFDLTIEGETFIDTGHQIQLLTALGDLQRPDRVRARFKAKVLGAATVTIELIIIGDQHWSTDLITGKWGQAPVEFEYNPSVLFDTRGGIGPVMERVVDPVRQSDEEIDGRAVYHVTAHVAEEVVGKLTMYTLMGSPITVDLWIDKETNDLLRARLAEPASPERENPATWVLNLSKHNESITIEPPV